MLCSLFKVERIVLTELNEDYYFYYYYSGLVQKRTSRERKNGLTLTLTQNLTLKTILARCASGLDPYYSPLAADNSTSYNHYETDISVAVTQKRD